MKDEIKEILDSIQEHLKEKEENFKKGAVDSTVYYLYCDNARTLLDYITNLQEENEKLKEELQQEKKDFKETNDYCFELKDYKSRNEKIIRKISLYRMDDITMESNRILNDLLNVVLGEDKDVKD